MCSLWVRGDRPKLALSYFHSVLFLEVSHLTYGRGGGAGVMCQGLYVTVVLLGGFLPSEKVKQRADTVSWHSPSLASRALLFASTFVTS